MENRPVFESFDEFIKFVYEAALNEGLAINDFAELQRSLGGYGLNDEGKTALAAIEEVTIKGDIQGAFSNGARNVLVRMAECIQKMTLKDKTKISSIDFDLQVFKYGNSIAGLIRDEEGNRVGFAEYLATLNLKNIRATKHSYYDSEKRGFKSYKNEDDWIQGTGPINQYIMVKKDDVLDAKKWLYNNPVKNPVLKTPAKFINKPQESSRKGSKEISTQYYFYYPVRIDPQGGESYKSREVLQYERPKAKTPVKLKPIVIQDNNTLFDFDKSVLKEEGKAAILAALGNVASANTITVTGGASQEGDEARNETLCRERAKAVADYIKSTTSFKSADVEVSPKLDIQPKESAEDRKTWRRVTLNVQGEYLAPVDKDTKELIYMASDDSKKADLIIIAQAVIQLNSKVIA